MEVIAVLNQKGGSGKTTVATHLARTRQLQGAEVLLLTLAPGLRRLLSEKTKESLALTKSIEKTKPTPSMIITLREYVQLTCAVSLGVAREVCAASLGVQVRCWERWEEGTRTMGIAYWELAVFKLSQGQQATNYQLLYARMEQHVGQQSLYEEMNALIDLRSTRKQGTLPTSFTDSLKLHIEQHRTSLVASEVFSIELMEQHSADTDSRISAVPQGQCTTDNKLVEQQGRGEYTNFTSALGMLKSAQDSRRTPAEVVAAVREVAENTLGGCDNQNDRLTAQAMANLFDVGATKAAAYVAFAKLKNDDPVLKQLLAGHCSSIREAYKMASARLRKLRADADRKALALMGIKVDGAS